VETGAQFVRQYFEYKLGRVITRLQIPVPPDYATRGDRRTLSTYMDAITAAVKLYQLAGICVLTGQQMADLTGRHVPAILSNFVSHYETCAGSPFGAYALIGVLQSVDDLANCFTYQDISQPRLRLDFTRGSIGAHDRDWDRRFRATAWLYRLRFAFPIQLRP
jgi:hypothetical protein